MWDADAVSCRRSLGSPNFDFVLLPVRKDSIKAKALPLIPHLHVPFRTASWMTESNALRMSMAAAILGSQQLGRSMASLLRGGRLSGVLSCSESCLRLVECLVSLKLPLYSFECHTFNSFVNVESKEDGSRSAHLGW